MTFKKFVYSKLPTSVRVQGYSYLPNVVADLWDWATRGHNDPEIPPRHLNIAGKGPYHRLGENNLSLCRTIGGLQPNHAVLDIGCGTGRTAFALTKFLSHEGRYAGFDIIDFAIEWCKTHIGTKHSNFSFFHADIYNNTYNARGSISPDNYRFPFSNEEFTFVLAASVFTHLLPAATENYIAEASRVLRTGGCMLSTWFLLDRDTEAGMAQKRAGLNFPHRFEVHAQRALHAPEQAVAYRRQYVQDLFSRNGFALEKVLHGGWSGAQTYIDSGQDVVFARRV